MSIYLLRYNLPLLTKPSSKGDTLLVKFHLDEAHFPSSLSFFTINGRYLLKFTVHCQDNEDDEEEEEVPDIAATFKIFSAEPRGEEATAAAAKKGPVQTALTDFFSSQSQV